MFAKEIDSVSLATDIADELFPNITGSVYGRDVTFIATLRALLHQRVPAEKRNFTVRKVASIWRNALKPQPMSSKKVLLESYIFTASVHPMKKISRLVFSSSTTMQL